MDRERLAWLRLLAVATDAVVLGATWAVATGVRAHLEGPGVPPLPADRSAPLGWLIIPVWLAALAASGSYHALRRESAGALVARVGNGVAAAVLVVPLLLFLARIPVNRSLLLGFAALSLPAVAASRGAHALALRALRRRRFDPHRLVLVGDAEAVKPLLARLERHPGWGLAVVDQVRPDELGRLGAALIAVDEVQVVGAVSPQVVAEVARWCDELGLPWSLDGSFLGARTARADLVDLDGYPLITFRAASDASPERLAKRALDVAGALALGALAVVPLAVAMAAIRLQDGGPAVFRQTRVGRYGRPFTLYKLRTMIPAAGDPPPGRKPDLDPRVTPVGAVLRRWSLDELPQLLNVLRGEMSLVGPRPPVPSQVARYEPWQRRRLSVRPGLTGLWQVSGRADLPIERWIELDLQYVDRWSLALDLVVLLRTVPAVLLGTGAR